MYVCTHIGIGKLWRCGASLVRSSGGGWLVSCAPPPSSSVDLLEPKNRRRELSDGMLKGADCSPCGPCITTDPPGQWHARCPLCPIGASAPHAQVGRVRATLLCCTSVFFMLFARCDKRCAAASCFRCLHHPGCGERPAHSAKTRLLTLLPSILRTIAAPWLGFGTWCLKYH